MVEYANPNEYTAKLEAIYPLEERVRHFKEAPDKVVYRVQAFHGWGGRTTDDTYYVVSNGELRHNQIDVKMLGGRPISNSSRDSVVKRNPRMESIIGAVISGAVGLSALMLDYRQDVPLAPYVGFVEPLMVAPLMVAIGYLMPVVVRSRPGDSRAWKIYQDYRKENKK